MKEKTIISTTTLVTSLLAYWYARTAGKDAAPLVMLGGFIGSLIGDGIAEQLMQKNTDNGDKDEHL